MSSLPRSALKSWVLGFDTCISLVAPQGSQRRDHPPCQHSVWLLLLTAVPGAAIWGEVRGSLQSHVRCS